MSSNSKLNVKDEKSEKKNVLDSESNLKSQSDDEDKKFSSGSEIENSGKILLIK